MTVTPEADAALTAAAVAIHDADCPDTHCSGAALGNAYRLARVALEAAEPHIREAVQAEDDRAIAAAVGAAIKETRKQVYAEIRQLATELGATYEERRPCNCGVSHDVALRQFADRLCDWRSPV